MRVTGPLLVALAGTLALAATAAPVAAARAPVPDSTSFERGHAAYMDRRFDAARTWFERAVAESGSNARARAWLAYAWVRLEDPEIAWRQAHVALADDPCETAAWAVLSRSINPQYGEWARSNSDSSWTCLLAGVRCDSLDGDLWKDIWIGALERADTALAARAVRGLHEAGFLRAPLLANSRWALGDLPPRAVLLVNGDADCYPTLVVQQINGLRPDVTMVHLSLLDMPWYRRHVRDRLGMRMPFSPGALDSLDWLPTLKGELFRPSLQVVGGWMDMRANGLLDRPLAMAATVDRSSTPGAVRECGAFKLLHPEYRGEVDTATVRHGLMGLDFAQLAGDGVTQADRSPYMRGSGQMVRLNVASAAATYYFACRQAGEDRAAEALRKWALAGLETLDAASPECEYLRSLPGRYEDAIRDWEARKREESRKEK